MSYVCHSAAFNILEWLHRAEADLVGKRVQTFGGAIGEVKDVRLDDDHGLCFTFDEKIDAFVAVELNKRRRYFPVSAIRLML